MGELGQRRTTASRRTLAAFASIALISVLGLFGVATVAGAQEGQASIGGLIEREGQPVSGVSVDLFSADASGNRVEYLRSTTTGADDQDDGRYEFSVDPGCYSITAIAPQGDLFTNGKMWMTTALCVDPGESRSDVDAALASGSQVGVDGLVLRSGTGNTVDGVVVDLFRATADGSRGSYIGSAESGSDVGVGGEPGRYRFDVDPGCYITTYIAPDGDRWEVSDSPWLNRGFCAVSDEVTIEPVLLAPSVTDRTIEVDAVITREGLPVNGLAFDVFSANADGSRGRYVASGETGPGDSAVRIQSGDACWVVTLIGAEGDKFDESGSRWLNRGFCTEPSIDSYQVEGALTGLAATTCAAGAEFELVFRDDFDGSELAEHWLPFYSVGNAGYGLRRPSAITVENGLMVITAEMQDGKLVSGGASHDFGQQYGKYRFRVRTDRDPSLATSGTILTWPTSGVHPRDGENDIYETLVQTADRNPFFTFIHEPFGTVHDQVYIVHEADATQFQIMTMEWTPDRMVITREGPGGQNQIESHEIIENSDDLIPDNPHSFHIQLDAWRDSLDAAVQMHVDWVEVSTYCN